MPSPVWVATAVILVLIILLFPLIILNRGSDQVFEIIKPVGFAVAGAWIYLLFVVIIPQPPKEENKFQVSIFSKPGPELLRLYPLDVGSPSSSSQHVLDKVWRYAFSESTLLDWQGAKPPVKRERKRLSAEELAKLKDPEHVLFTDLLELGFFEWMRQHYGSHWDIFTLNYSGFGGGGSKIETKPGAEKEVTRISRSDILSLLHGNRLVNAGALLTSDYVVEGFEDKFFDGITLPKGAELIVNDDAPTKEIIIRKKGYFEYRVSIRHIGMVHGLRVGPGKRLGELLGLDSKIANDVIMHAIDVDFQFQRSRLRRWAPSVIRYSEWAKEMANRFEREFGWDKMQAELEKAIQRN